MEELIAQLVEFGISEEDARRYAEEPWTAPENVQVVMQTWQEQQGPVVSEMPDEENLDGTQRFIGTEDFDIAQKMAAGEPLSAEEEERYGQAGAGTQQAMQELAADLAGEEQLRYDWVYNQMQLTPGSLDSNEALLSLAPVLDEITDVDIDQTKPEEELVLDIKKLLANSPGNLMVQTAIAEWGRANESYLSPEEQKFSNLISKGVPSYRAKTLMKVGSSYEVDAEQLYDIWNNANRDPGKMAADGIGGPGSIGMGGPVRKNVFQVAKDFKQGLDMYEGSHVLAGLHVSDPELAAKLREDPYSLDSGEIQRALDYLGHGQGSGKEGEQTGDPQLDWLKVRAAGGHQASAVVDTDAVKEAVNTLAQAWNMVGAEDVAVEVSKDVVAGAVARARSNLPNPFGPIEHGVDVIDSTQNTEARIRQQLRENPEYDELFGDKHAAESEEEYVSRFERKSQSILGDDNAAAVRNAMRSGNVNTIYQQGLNTEVGDSSTRFQEIIARNARVFQEML